MRGESMTNVSRFKVRYAETDQMGVVYYANYFVWMEIGRTNLLRDTGITYKELESRGVILPVAKAYAKYAASSFYDDEIAVHSTVTNLSGPRIRIDYRIYRNDSELVCTGFTEHAFMSRETRKIIRCPEDLAKKVVVPENAEKYLTRV